MSTFGSPPPIQESSFRCKQCAYDLSGAAVGGVCPECGTAVTDSLRAATDQRGTSSKATTCMIMGILSLVICGPIFGPIAIVYYYSAMREMESGLYSGASRTMAKAGLIMGIVALSIAGLWILVVLAGGLS